ncbi:HD domain-containing protein [Acidianus sulfidivorans JP7]|uniref:HD/PDEase domain-containing protein n=1 Tax=Acidianus sulfidivorans JP7 TaxID=619593 RepID=A0A2U9IQ23_9CREN|nr:HD domain-containing protein [Acidianus sulfidivorans]AWR98086.1 HD domain-containing protein [Acidianus sulfidivorans JP7]
MTKYLRIDPLTLSAITNVSDSDRTHIINVVKNIVDNVKGKYKCESDCSKFLNEVADQIVESINRGWEYYFKYLLCSRNKDNAFCREVDTNKFPDEFYFVLIPADTRFPGFTNSIGDHMITTSAFAVSAALSYYDKCGKIQIGDKTLSREEVRGIVRVAALLHDIGKPPPMGHADRTKDIVFNLFKDINEEIAKILSNTASRHHYGQNYKEKPSNVLEWIIAYADKASSSSRAFLVKDLPNVFKDFLDLAKDIQKIGYDVGGQDYLKRIENSVSETDEDSDSYRTYGFLSKDENQALNLAKKLIDAEKDLCNGEKLLALYHVEVPSIKSYLKRGRELSIYAGYSLLIDSFIHEVSDYIKENVGKEAVISDEGGSVLAIVPSTFNLDLKNFISKTFGSSDILPFDFLRESKMEFKFAEAHLGPVTNWKGWNNKNPYVRDSVRSFGSLLSKFFSGEYTKTLILFKPLSESPKELCSKCKINPAYSDDTCLSCSLAEKFYRTYRQMITGSAGGSNKEEDMIKKLRSFKLIEELREILDKNQSGYVNVPSTIDDFEKRVGTGEKNLDYSRNPALFVADGDNFGMIKSNASTLTQYIEITRRFTYMIYYSLLYALTRVAEFNSNLFQTGYVELVPILIGGDDISIIITAQNLLQFAYYLDEALESINGRVKKGDGKYENIADKIKEKKPYIWFGISAGAYIYSDTAYPLFLAREEAETLEHISKKASKTNFQTNYVGSGLILTIISDKFMYEEENNVLSFLGQQAKDIYRHLSTLESGGISYRKLLDYVKFNEDEIRILYDVIRANEGGNKAEDIFDVLIEAKKNYQKLSNYLLLLMIMSKVLEKKADKKGDRVISYYEAKWA